MNLFPLLLLATLSSTFIITTHAYLYEAKPCTEDDDCLGNMSCHAGYCTIPMNFPCNAASGPKCQEGTKCVGNNVIKLCKKPMKVGGQCDLEPYWVCMDGLTCGDDNYCKQVLPLGGTNCSVPHYICEKDNECVDGTCINLLSVGESDCTQASTNCEGDAKCKDKTCVNELSLGETGCDAEFDVCADDYECKDNTCVKELPLGGTDCTEDDYVCVGDAVCRDKKCVNEVLLGESGCFKENYKCSVGLTCKNDTCFNLVPLGETDCTAAFNECEDQDADCEGKTCIKRLNRGQSDCTKENYFCVEGLECVDKTCVEPLPLGGTDCTDDFFKCADDYDCVEGRCVETVPLGGSGCSKVNYDCENGVVCNADGICVIEVPRGETDCSIDNYDCVQGTVCKHETCFSQLQIGEEDCTEEFNMCANGLECQGTKCVRVLAKGEMCADENKVCQPDLECVESVCTQILDQGERNCLLDNVNCKDGLRCSEAGVCTKILKLGESDCNEPNTDCENQLVCNDAGTCVREIPLGGQNCLDPNTECAEDTECDDGTCVIKLQQGDSGCDKDNYQCEPKTLSCIADVCTKVLPIGTQGCNEPNTQCDDGFECNTVDDTGTCVERVPLGQSCADPFHVCEENTECCDDTNVCMKILDLGDTGCTAKNSKCEEGNMCVNDKCVVVVDFGEKDCNLENYDCVNGTVCLDQTCIRRVPVGDSCADEDVFCQLGLACESDVCKIPENNSCNGGDNGDFCVDGTTCVGTENPENKLCKTLRKPGESCEMTDFDVCENDLLCQNNVCKIKENNSCSGDGLAAFCADGTDCAGPFGEEQCHKPVSVGQACDDEYQVCESQLSCEERLCKVPVNGNCGVENFVCVIGSKCLGNDDDKQCKKPIQVGETCTDSPFDCCVEGSTCNRDKCRINENEDCLDNEELCVDGTQCVGDSGEKKCTKPVPLNGNCASKFLDCEENLVCDSATKTCKIDIYGTCSGENMCLTSTRCVTVKSISKCLPLLNPGDECGNPVHGVCPMNYMCLRRKCEDLLNLPKWYPCHFLNAKCAPGLVCAGPHNYKYCVNPIPLNQACKDDHAFLVCAEGLQCKGGYCRE